MFISHKYAMKQIERTQLMNENICKKLTQNQKNRTNWDWMLSKIEQNWNKNE